MTRSLLSALAAFPSILLSGEVTSPPAPTPSALDLFNWMNAATTRFNASFSMDFENSGAEMENQAFQVDAFLSKPVDFLGGYSFVPMFEYEANFLRPDGVPAGIPLGDEDLHEIGLSMFFYKMRPGSPWITAAWLNPSISTDFQSVSGDDFFLDAAAAVGYQVNESLIVGAGVGALNLTGDTAVYPGIGFFWNPTQDISVSLYGPNFRAGWELTDSWKLGFEVGPNGGIWNIDTTGGSRNIDYSSFRVGLGSSHRLTGDLWFSYGGGITVGNSLNITNTDGSDLFKNTLDDLDEGVYGFLSLNLKSW